MNLTTLPELEAFYLKNDLVQKISNITIDTECQITIEHIYNYNDLSYKVIESTFYQPNKKEILTTIFLNDKLINNYSAKFI